MRAVVDVHLSCKPCVWDEWLSIASDASIRANTHIHTQLITLAALAMGRDPTYEYLMEIKACMLLNDTLPSSSSSLDKGDASSSSSSSDKGKGEPTTPVAPSSSSDQGEEGEETPSPPPPFSSSTNEAEEEEGEDSSSRNNHQPLIQEGEPRITLERLKGCPAVVEALNRHVRRPKTWEAGSVDEVCVLGRGVCVFYLDAMFPVAFAACAHTHTPIHNDQSLTLQPILTTCDNNHQNIGDFPDAGGRPGPDPRAAEQHPGEEDQVHLPERRHADAAPRRAGRGGREGSQCVSVVCDVMFAPSIGSVIHTIPTIKPLLPRPLTHPPLSVTMI